MWDFVLLLGLVLLIIGGVKRKTDWGKTLAVVGVVGIVISLVVAGPDMLDAAQRGFQEGYEAAQGPNASE